MQNNIDVDVLPRPVPYTVLQNASGVAPTADALLEYRTPSLLLERVVALLREAGYQHVAVGLLVAVLDQLGDALGHLQPLDSCLGSQLFDELPLGLQTFLKLVHGG